MHYYKVGCKTKLSLITTFPYALVFFSLLYTAANKGSLDFLSMQAEHIPALISLLWFGEFSHQVLHYSGVGPSRAHRLGSVQGQSGSITTPGGFPQLHIPALGLGILSTIGPDTEHGAKEGIEYKIPEGFCFSFHHYTTLTFNK